jgi:hypothetical protein
MELQPEKSAAHNAVAIVAICFVPDGCFTRGEAIFSTAS